MAEVKKLRSITGDLVADEAKWTFASPQGGAGGTSWTALR